MALRLSLTFSGTRGTAPSARDVAAYGERAERLGFHAVYSTDHFVYSGATLHAGSIVSALAGATERIALGFAAYVLPLRHPIAAAKELATLDAICGGRLIVGLAAGSHAPEFAAFGLPFAERGRRLDEGIEALLGLWNGAASHDGPAWRFDDVVLRPEVVQRPHPPLWIGSWTGSARASRRVARYAQGWQASGLHTSIDEIGEGWRRIEAACAEAGRDAATIGRAYVNMVTHLAAREETAWDEVNPALRGRADLRLIGTPEQAIEKLRRLESAGIEEVSFLVQGDVPAQVELIAREVMPAVG